MRHLINISRLYDESKRMSADVEWNGTPPPAVLQSARGTDDDPDDDFFYAPGTHLICPKSLMQETSGRQSLPCWRGLCCVQRKIILDNLRARNPFFLCPASCLFPSKRVDPLVSVVQYIMRLPFEITLYVGDKKTTSHTDSSLFTLLYTTDACY